LPSLPTCRPFLL